MSTAFTGKCLCGSVQFESSSEAAMQANCHCDDCRRSGGGVYASYAFVPASALTVTQGETASYTHTADSGSTMEKRFCAQCGSQMFGKNGNHPDRVGVRIGVIDDASWFQPQASVYISRKLASTPLDPNTKAFDKMPG